MSTPFSPDASYWADPSSRPAVLATADGTPPCPGPAMNTVMSPPLVLTNQ
jgi:hypothetical protein